jgi:hypothetical protein
MTSRPPRDVTGARPAVGGPVVDDPAPQQGVAAVVRLASWGTPDTDLEGRSTEPALAMQLDPGGHHPTGARKAEGVHLTPELAVLTHPGQDKAEVGSIEAELRMTSNLSNDVLAVYLGAVTSA